MQSPPSDKVGNSPTPLILAIVLLLLPVLYVGSYFALVVPSGGFIADPAGTTRFAHPLNGAVMGRYTHYVRFQPACEFIFWPLEQIDRNVRPEAWEPTVNTRTF